jgi:hypothetical protein
MISIFSLLRILKLLLFKIKCLIKLIIFLEKLKSIIFNSINKLHKVNQLNLKNKNNFFLQF